MKEKNKSILKKCGVVALACLGAVTFAGCGVNVANLDDEGLINRINEMYYEQIETNENLEILLNNQNAIDNAWGLYQKAIANLYLNKDGIRDNMTITSSYSSDGGMFVEKNSFYKYNNNDILMNEITMSVQSAGVFYTGICYEEGDKLYSSESSGAGFDKATEVSFAKNMDKFVYDSDLIGIIGEGYGLRHINSYISKDNISSIIILPNGNYSIEFVYNNFEGSTEEEFYASFIYKVEISKDAKLYSQEFNEFNIWSDKESSTTQSTVTYTYNDVNVELLLSNLNQAKSAQ